MPDILHDFLSRMDPEYFRRFEPATIAQHIRLAARLTPEHLCEIDFAEQRDRRFEVTVVAYDYFSEFATICGLLSAFGLNIEEGQIYTFTGDSSGSPSKLPSQGAPRRRPKTRPGLSRKKIVDVFRVQPVPGASLGQDEQRRLADSLHFVIKLLDGGQFAEARHVVNRQLVEQLAACEWQSGETQ